jgi:hypothetical protein
MNSFKETRRFCFNETLTCIFKNLVALECYVFMCNSSLIYPYKCWQSLPLPDGSPVVCLAAAADTVWILTTQGKIYIRQGVTDKCPSGRTWKELSLAQIGKFYVIS